MFLSFLDSFLDESRNDNFLFKIKVFFLLFVENSGSQTLKLLSIFSDYSLKNFYVCLYLTLAAGT